MTDNPLGNHGPKARDRNPSFETPRAVKLTDLQRAILLRFQRAELRLSKSEFEGGHWIRLGRLADLGLLRRHPFGLFSITPAGRQALQEGPEHE